MINKTIIIIRITFSRKILKISLKKETNKFNNQPSKRKVAPKFKISEKNK